MDLRPHQELQISDELLEDLDQAINRRTSDAARELGTSWSRTPKRHILEVLQELHERDMLKEGKDGAKP